MLISNLLIPSEAVLANRSNNPSVERKVVETAILLSSLSEVVNLVFSTVNQRYFRYLYNGQKSEYIDTRECDKAKPMC